MFFFSGIGLIIFWVVVSFFLHKIRLKEYEKKGGNPKNYYQYH